MFKAAINAEVFKKAIYAVSTIVDKAKFRITRDAIFTMAKDPANVAMVVLDLNSKAFDTFEATDGEISIDLVQFIDILGRATGDDRIELNLNEATRKVEIRIGGSIYTISLLDPTSISMDATMPSLEWPTRIVWNGTELRRVIKDAKKVSDQMALGIRNKMFYVDVILDSGGSRCTSFDSAHVSTQAGSDVRSLFSLDYLNDIVKSLDKAELVNIYLGSEYPAKFIYKIAGGYGTVSYLLAPQILDEKEISTHQDQKRAINKQTQRIKSYDYDVFICHSSKDEPLIEKIIKEFKKENISYWVDSEQIRYGDSIINKIEDGLTKSKYIIPCLSDNLNRTGWTRAEYGAILNSEFCGNSDRLVIPLKLDNCSDNNIPLLLRDKKRVTYSNKAEFIEFIEFLKK